MKKISIIFSLFLFIHHSGTFGQLPDTDIFLVGIKKEKDKLIFGTPENITHRKGYDNQPCFGKDGKSVLFVSIIDTTQSDVYSYDLKTKKTAQLTATDVSEYSPTFSPGGKNLTVVRVDKDSGQRAYELPLADIKSPKLIHGTDSIGYFCWLNDSLLAMFILGPSNTLQVLNVHSGIRTLVASDIGRCLKISPDQKSLYFVIKGNEKEWFIYAMNILTLKTERVIQLIEGNEDFAVMPDGTFLLGSAGKLFQWNKNKTENWTEAADLSSTVRSFYRIVVNADGTQLALVAFTGEKP